MHPETKAPIAQLVRASFLYSGCRGFKPLWEYLRTYSNNFLYLTLNQKARVRFPADVFGLSGVVVAF